jgi:hypothetical protein
MRRVLVLIVGILAAWLGTATPANALTLPSTGVAVYGYDCSLHAAVLTDNTNERGPPALRACSTTSDAVGPGSNGSCARQNGLGAVAAYDYDDSSRLVQVDIGTPDSREPVGADYGNLSFPRESCVAAKAGPLMGPIADQVARNLPEQMARNQDQVRRRRLSSSRPPTSPSCPRVRFRLDGESARCPPRRTIPTDTGNSRSL